MHCVMSTGRRVRACTRLSEAAKPLATRDHVRGISGPSTLPNNSYRSCCNNLIFVIAMDDFGGSAYEPAR
jgi:hypothetical protein